MFQTVVSYICYRISSHCQLQAHIYFWVQHLKFNQQLMDTTKSLPCILHLSIIHYTQLCVTIHEIRSVLFSFNPKLNSESAVMVILNIFMPPSVFFFSQFWLKMLCIDLASFYSSWRSSHCNVGYTNPYNTLCSMLFILGKCIRCSVQTENVHIVCKI